MRLISWNMARGPRPKGLDRDPWDLLASLEPDIALLQEAAAPPEEFGGTFHLNRTRRGWGTGIWSRFPLGSLDTLDGVDATELATALPALKGYVASAVVDPPGGGSIVVVSVHAYPSKVPEKYLGGLDPDVLVAPPQKDVWPGDLLWWLTRRLPTETVPAVVGGDWNTARLFDENYGPRGNREFFERMAETGWHEAMRKFFDSEVQTYYREGRGPYQLDHVSLTGELYDLLGLGLVDASDGVLAASDHAPIVLDFDVADTLSPQ